MKRILLLCTIAFNILFPANAWVHTDATQKENLKKLLTSYDDFYWAGPDRLSVTKDGKTGLIDLEGNVIIPFEYEKVELFDKNHVRAYKGVNYDYINRLTGTLVCSSPIELSDQGFLDGVASFNIGGAYGVIDSIGNVIVKPQYEFVSDFYNGRAKVVKKGKAGYIDKTGKVVIPIKYINGSPYDGLFDSGVAVVRNKDKYGVIDIEGNQVFPFDYDLIGEFNEGIALARIGNDTYNEGYLLMADGKRKLISYYLDNGYYIPKFIEGKVERRHNAKIGFMDTEGKYPVDYNYDGARVFNEGYLLVKKDNLWGIIDGEGNVIVNFQYEDAWNMKDGLFSVKKNGKWGVIDHNGLVIVPFLFTKEVPYGNWTPSGNEGTEEFIFFTDGLAKKGIQGEKMELLEY